MTARTMAQIEWREAHRDQENERRRKWRKMHPEGYREAVRSYYWKHREQRLTYNVIWRKANRDKSQVSIARWRKANPEKRHAWQKAHPEKLREWRKAHPDRVRESLKRLYHKRKRGFTTSTILGAYFSGSHLHHITPNLAMYIPSALHKSIRHNIWTGEGMDEINWKAWAFNLKGFSL